MVAISIAGVSGLNVTYARFSPFMVTYVLTFVTFALKSCSISFLMSCLVACL